MTDGVDQQTPARVRLRDVHRVLFLVLAAVATAASLTGLSLPLSAQIVCLALLVALLGVPHGALDAHLARARLGVRGRLPMGLYLLTYVGLAAGVVWVWLQAPLLSLCVFLVISALHFSFDWSGQTGPIGAIGFGLSVICLPTLLFAEEVNPIFVILTSAEASAVADIVEIMQIVMYPAVTMMLYGAARSYRHRGLLGLEAAAILLLAITFPPLLFFTLYFCGLHSPRHLIDTSAELGTRSWQRLIIMAAPATLATFAGALWLGIQWSELDVGDTAIKVVFIGLAALTVPHMLTVAAVALAGQRQSVPAVQAAVHEIEEHAEAVQAQIPSSPEKPSSVAASQAGPERMAKAEAK